MTPPYAPIEWQVDGSRDCSTKLGQFRNSTSAMTAPAALREWPTSLTTRTTMLGKLSGSSTVLMHTANRFVSLLFLPDASATPSTRLSCQADP